jgi:hypothetical protein
MIPELCATQKVLREPLSVCHIKYKESHAVLAQRSLLHIIKRIIFTQYVA